MDPASRLTSRTVPSQRESGDMEESVPGPLSPPDVTARGITALPPYVSNGVIGVRYPGLPHLPGTTMVNGFAGVNLDDGVEGFARAPFVIATTSRSTASGPRTPRNGLGWSDSATTSPPVSCRRAGHFVSTARTPPSRLARLLPTVCPCSRRVRDHRPGRSTPRTWRSPRASTRADVPGTGDAHAQPQDQGPNEGVDGRLRWHAPGDISTLGVAYATSFRGDAGAKRETATRDERGWFSTTYRLRARAGRRYRLSHISASVPSLSHAQPDEQAGRLAALAAQFGLERLRDENRSIWNELWKGRITIDGADRALAGASLTRAPTTC